MITYLTATDVIEAGLTFKETLSLVEESLREHGEKQVENPPKISVHPKPDAFVTAMPAFLPRKQVCGMKWVSGFPSNVPKGLPTISGVIVLNDPYTGLVKAVMDGTYITAIRTVAVSVVAAKHLCNKDAKVMAIVGCGLQGKNHAAALAHALPSLTKALVFDNNKNSLTSFVEQIKNTAPSLLVEVCDSAEQAIRSADLVVTATGKLLEPIFHHEWVKSGALVLPVHTLGWNATAPTSLDKLICDDWEQFKAYSEGWYEPLPTNPYAETGEIVAGKKAGRENTSERIINFNAGLAIHDVLVANAIYKKAKEIGLGKELKNQEIHPPIFSIPE